MKKFLLKGVLFLAIVACVDSITGNFFDFLHHHAKGGSTAKNEYIANGMEDDVVIFGSSRSVHHYNPYILADSLGVSVYNCGEKGNGAILAYGRYKMMTSRYKPQLIVYEVTPGYDYFVWDPYKKYLGSLRQYYDKPGIKEIFRTFDDYLSPIRMQSKMYQNNSRLIQEVFDNLVYRDNNRGYMPLYGSNYDSNAGGKVKREYVIDTLKLQCMETLFKDVQADSIPIVMAISPVYRNAEGPEMYKEAYRISEVYNIPILDYRDFEPISSDSSFFQDGVHMNTKGAELFSSLIASELKHFLHN